MTFWIPCGAGLGALGLYILINTGAGVRTVVQWVGWGLYCLGGVLIAGIVLESTGSFWELLFFCALSTAALLCATIGAVRRPRGVAGGVTGSRRWFVGAAAAVAAILVWRGNQWSGGVLFVGVACLASRDWVSRILDSVPGNNERSLDTLRTREPALACGMWGLLISGLMSALQSQQSAGNNLIAVACGMFALGALEIAVREESRLCGLGSLLLGALLVCAAGTDRRHSELLSLVVLGSVAVNLAVIAQARRRLFAPAADPITARGDA